MIVIQTNLIMNQEPSLLSYAAFSPSPSESSQFPNLVHPSENFLGFYRSPAIHNDTLVFTAEGDLWSVGIEGGLARRLTTHHGVESHAAIAPNGDRIAFSAEYEGSMEVYSMPVMGGLPITGVNLRAVDAKIPLSPSPR